MSQADAVAAIMFAAVTLYAVFGGADFGSGTWDLTAGNAHRGGTMRRLIDHSIGPVWEANHVWLIFVLVVLWTAFPTAFAAMMRTLAIPFWLAGLGIVARGAGFAFRKFSATLHWARGSGIVFATSSLLTPFFLGAIAGSVASGRVPATGTGDMWTSWLNPTSLLGGILAVATCTFLAGVLLTAEADRLDLHVLCAQLRHRSLIGGAITGALVVSGLPILAVDDQTLVDGLLGPALPLVVASGLAGIAAMWDLWYHQYRRARFTAAAAVALVVAGWGAAQYPWILVDELRIDEAAGAPAALTGLLVASALAALLVVPPLVYLLVLADSNQVGVAPQQVTNPPRREAA